MGNIDKLILWRKLWNYNLIIGVILLFLQPIFKKYLGSYIYLNGILLFLNLTILLISSFMTFYLKRMVDSNKKLSVKRLNIFKMSHTPQDRNKVLQFIKDHPEKSAELVASSELNMSDFKMSAILVELHNRGLIDDKNKITERGIHFPIDM